MDNKHISIQSAGRHAFDLAFKVSFMSEYDKEEPKAKATHYFEHKEKGLVFLWSEDKSVNSVKLPVALNWKGAAELAWQWLSDQPEENYQDYLDHDGSNGKGFRVYNEVWGHVISHYAIIAVLPIWAWHGK
jgi:hypothetical protein